MGFPVKWKWKWKLERGRNFGFLYWLWGSKIFDFSEKFGKLHELRGWSPLKRGNFPIKPTAESTNFPSNCTISTCCLQWKENWKLHNHKIGCKISFTPAFFCVSNHQPDIHCSVAAGKHWMKVIHVGYIGRICGIKTEK